MFPIHYCLSRTYNYFAVIRSDSMSNQAVFSKHTDSGSNQLITGFWNNDSGKVWHINLHSAQVYL